MNNQDQGKENMKVEVPQFEKFSPLLKIKLAISVIDDAIRLAMTVAAICGMVYVGFYAYDEVNKNQTSAQQKKGKS